VKASPNPATGNGLRRHAASRATLTRVGPASPGRGFAICGSAIPARNPLNGSFATVPIEGIPVVCAVLPSHRPRFTRRAPEFARRVLLRVRAFSCNYRDRALILRMAKFGPPDSFYLIGSEFCAEVIETGAGVTRVAIGDRVIGDNDYASLPRGPRPAGWCGGLPTNHASREYLVLPEEKVMPIPAAMPDRVAAAFSVGAQTTYSMIARLGVRAGANVLVTAARSNTSLFAIATLRRLGANVYATTRSSGFADRLRALGVGTLFQVGQAGQGFSEHPELRETADRIGGFECVIDPFFDVHLRQVLPVMAFGGRYVTCGLFDQHVDLLARGPVDPPIDYRGALGLAVVKNIELIGNCIGRSCHLAEAIREYERGEWDVAIDSVFTGDEAGVFLDRTFNAPERFGKVVYAYD
jgi:NADPH:quinone reductase-like Zn-dependent oxidoreductase